MALILFCYLFIYQENNLQIGEGEVYYQDFDNYGAIGAPALPMEIRHFSIPAGQKLQSITVVLEDSVILTKDFIAKRVDPPQGGIEIPPPQNLPEIYPKKIVTHHFSTFRGLGLLSLMIMPVRYDHHKLIFYKKIRVIPHFTYCGIKPPTKMGKYSYQMMRNIYQDLTDEYPLLPPPAQGIDLLVVVPDALSSVAEGYARLKRLTGLVTMVVSYEQIIEQYSSSDAAASLRKGIRDLYQRYGFIFLTLIGDFDLIPARKFHWEYENCTFGREIPTDRYYACLDGAWNQDNDYYYGEIEDSVDLFPDVFVGRISVSDTRQGLGYLEKLSKMQYQPDTVMNDRIIFFASNLFQPGDGRKVADSIIEHIPDTLTPDIAILDQMQGNINKKAALDSLQAGFRIAFGIGHGNPTRFQYGYEYGEFPDYDALKNQNRAGLVYHITCSNCSYETDCVGEHLTNNRYGGCLAFVGPAWVSFLYPHSDFAEELVELLPNYPIGSSVLLATAPFIPQLNTDAILRLIAFEINTLGDPTLSFPLKRAVPIIQFSHPDTIPTGSHQIMVSYQPPEKSKISFLGGGCHKTSTANGSVSIESYAQHQGAGLLTLSRPGEQLITDTIAIIEPDYHLKIVDFDYRPGSPNPFEQGSLAVLIKNTGILPSPPAQINIATCNPEVDILSDHAQITAISPQDSLWSSPYFVIRFKDLQDNDEIKFAHVISTPNPEFFDTVALTISQPLVYRIRNILLDESGNKQIEPNEKFSLNIEFANLGSESGDTMVCKLAADSHYVDLTVDSLILNPLAADSNIILESFKGQATDYWYPDVQFTLSVDTTDYYFELRLPGAPTPKYVIPGDSGLVVEWEGPSDDDLCGFFAYREDQAGFLKRLNKYPVEIARITDTIGKNCDYNHRYYITALDTSDNESEFSTPIAANIISMHKGFPVHLSYYNFSSPRIADIDGDHPGLELIQGCWDGKLFRYFEDGSGGLLVDLGNPIWGTPAIGDIDADNSLEIAIGTRVDPGELWVLDKNGNPEQNFPITVDGQILSSVAISDLDDDPQLEFTLVTTKGIFYIIDHDGSYILERKLGGYHWGTPAIGDIDADDELEIIPPTGNDSVYVFEKDGSLMPPFPVAIPDTFFYGPSIANLDDDRFLEIALGIISGNDDRIVVLDDDGTVLSGWPVVYNQKNVDDHVAFGDLDADNRPELVVDYQIKTWTGGVAVLNPDASYLKGWPRLRGEGSSNPIVCDVDSDSQLDVIVGSADRWLYGYRRNGNYCPGFPVQLGHTIYTTPSVADVDLDGKLELAVTALDWKLYLFDLNGRNYPGALVWPCFRSDLMNTGCYKEPEVEIAESHDLFTNILGTIPVPAKSPVSLSYNTDDEILIRIFDVMGRVVRHARLKGRGSYKIRLPAGVYFIRLSSDQKKFNQKIVLYR